ncbi:hypothetical protein [Polaribacter sp. M15]
MKKTLFIYLSILIVISSCDPGESAETNIINNTFEDLSITFVSSQFPQLNESLSLGSNEKKTYSSNGFKGTSSYLLTFMDFDSIYIKNSSNKILKIFKENTSGKNIYNVNEYWTVRETSKNHFEYTYEITEEDLE